MRKTLLGFAIACLAISLTAVGLYSAQRTTYLSLPFTNDADMNDALRRIDENVGQVKIQRAVTSTAVFCGQLANSGTLYNNVCSTDGGHADCSIGGTACNALDDATRTNADAVLSTNLAVRVYGMRCTVSSAGSNGVAITLWDDAAASEFVCTVPTGSVDCQDSVSAGSDGVLTGTASLFSVATVTTEDLSAQDVRCTVSFSTGDLNN